MHTLGQITKLTYSILQPAEESEMGSTLSVPGPSQLKGNTEPVMDDRATVTSEGKSLDDMESIIPPSEACSLASVNTVILFNAHEIFCFILTDLYLSYIYNCPCRLPLQNMDEEQGLPCSMRKFFRNTFQTSKQLWLI